MVAVLSIPLEQRRTLHSISRFLSRSDRATFKQQMLPHIRHNFQKM